jgi:2-polyprenyl-3-methyl-5-hydroxy-6-metoxy-1,4-benzoquinol methylase
MQTNTTSMRMDRYESQDFDTYLEHERPEMLRFVPQNASKILDVGCAMGSFGRRLKIERSAEVWGVEINEHAAATATQRLDKVFCGSFDKNLDLPKHKFDCITFNDVLEHFADPYSALIYAKELLNDGGKVVASIPNVRYFDNVWKFLVDRDWQYTDQGILDRTHLRFFTQKSIVSTFEGLGYSIDCIQGIGELEQLHPYRTRKYKFLNRLLMNHISDMRYLQFAVVASPILSSENSQIHPID